jgi:hypothetical protein
MSKKKRSDSVLAALNPQQKAQLRAWLVDENKGYEEVRELLLQDFNLRVGVTAIRNFYALDCFSLRSSEAKEFAELVAEELRSSGETFDAATIELVKQKAFERAYAKNGNIEELATLTKILGDSAKLELKKRELELNREKFRQQIKSDIEKGLDALHSEIKGSPEALQLFDTLKAVVMRAAEGRK